MMACRLAQSLGMAATEGGGVLDCEAQPTNNDSNRGAMSFILVARDSCAWVDDDTLSLASPHDRGTASPDQTEHDVGALWEPAKQDGLAS